MVFLRRLILIITGITLCWFNTQVVGCGFMSFILTDFIHTGKVEVGVGD